MSCCYSCRWSDGRQPWDKRWQHVHMCLDVEAVLYIFSIYCRIFGFCKINKQVLMWSFYSMNTFHLGKTIWYTSSIKMNSVSCLPVMFHWFQFFVKFRKLHVYIFSKIKTLNLKCLMNIDMFFLMTFLFWYCSFVCFFIWNVW